MRKVWIPPGVSDWERVDIEYPCSFNFKYWAKVLSIAWVNHRLPSHSQVWAKTSHRMGRMSHLPLWFKGAICHFWDKGRFKCPPYGTNEPYAIVAQRSHLPFWVK